MSKVRDTESHKSGQEEEDIDFDFFSTPGRSEDSRKMSDQKKCDNDSGTGKSQVKSDMAATGTGVTSVKSGAKYKSHSSDTQSDCPKPVRVVEARLPVATLDEKHKKEKSNSKRRSNRSKSYSDSDTSSLSDSEDENNRKSNAKYKRPPSGKKSSENHENGDMPNKDSRSDIRNRYKLSDEPLPERPKTSKGRDRNDSDKHSDYDDRYSDSDSYSSSSYTTSSCTDSDTDTDSDVTRVSPLPSPREQETDSWTGHMDKKQAQKEHLKLKLKQQLLKGDRDSVDLRLLMQAVLDLEKEQESRPKKTEFLVPPPDSGKKGQRRNFSFSDNKATDIDRENQRLMKEILKEARAAREAKQKTKLQKKQQSAMSKLTSSAVNRGKNLRKIEMENQAMLKRLETAKPTRTLQRNHLLNDYSNQTLFGVSIATAHPTPKRKSLSPYSSSGMGSRTRSLSSFRSDTSSIASVSTMSTKSTSRRRVMSAHSPSKGKRTFVTRPAWESGW